MGRKEETRPGTATRDGKSLESSFDRGDETRGPALDATRRFDRDGDDGRSDESFVRMRRELSAQRAGVWEGREPLGGVGIVKLGGSSAEAQHQDDATLTRCHGRGLGAAISASSVEKDHSRVFGQTKPLLWRA